jgi:hypothetical protein
MRFCIQQFVRFNGARSEPSEVPLGVIQGSVLGLLFFDVHVASKNDLPLSRAAHHDVRRPCLAPDHGGENQKDRECAKAGRAPYPRARPAAAAPAKQHANPHTNRTHGHGVLQKVSEQATDFDATACITTGGC